MKKLILIVGLPLLLISCGGDEETKSIDQVIESEDLSQIRAKKSELSTEQSKIAEQLDRLDEAIKSLDKNRRMDLVSIQTIEDTLFKHYAEVQGNVATDENIIVYPEFSGILTNVRVNEGDRVSKGQVLARIDDGGLQSELAQLEAQERLAKTTYERQKRLWDQNIGSEMQYLEAKTNYEALQSSVQRLKSQLDKTVVRAPFSGVVDDVISEQGEVVNPGQNQLFRIISLDNMYVEADVPENYLSKISIGTGVKVNIGSVGREFEGKVSQVGNNINPNNRTFRIEVKVPNEKDLIKPNQIATIKLNDYTSENAIVIPESSIQKNAMGESIVYVLEQENDKNFGTARKVIVETGLVYNDSIEIKEGLTPGQILITDGAKNIRDGQEVKFRK
ncbi:efflux RND transporter periplasmic adaptor subunit [Christiangramia sediminis]|uniref:Efflux RND transporter periplasmic adaptor subunit n=1 Tax=Christiangramia sediminis TaxID=2881336 RepID=A0A9X1LJX7_9FLAO|nr:efflux RND transporter periplasmic adaptor subunit [Christiangramia sediminis]MCB7481689.1 efflux RND transporter periplasmic adaptor subunit [Christiangramia sediminis]